MRPLELVRKHHYQQKAKNACVPAAIRMVMSSYSEELGEQHTEEELLRLLGTSETGSMLEALNRLEELGFQAEAVPSDLTEIHLYFRLFHLEAILDPSPGPSPARGGELDACEASGANAFLPSPGRRGAGGEV